jgi:hypothetical protein
VKLRRAAHEDKQQQKQTREQGKQKENKKRRRRGAQTQTQLPREQNPRKQTKEPASVHAPRLSMDRDANAARNILLKVLPEDAGGKKPSRP